VNNVGKSEGAGDPDRHFPRPRHGIESRPGVICAVEGGQVDGHLETHQELHGRGHGRARDPRPCPRALRKEGHELTLRQQAQGPSEGGRVLPVVMNGDHSRQEQEPGEECVLRDEEGRGDESRGPGKGCGKEQGIQEAQVRRDNYCRTLQGDGVHGGISPPAQEPDDDPPDMPEPPVIPVERPSEGVERNLQAHRGSIPRPSGSVNVRESETQRRTRRPRYGEASSNRDAEQDWARGRAAAEGVDMRVPKGRTA